MYIMKCSNQILRTSIRELWHASLDTNTQMIQMITHSTWGYSKLKIIGHPLWMGTSPLFSSQKSVMLHFLVLGTDGNLSALGGFADKHWFLKKSMRNTSSRESKAKNDTNVSKYFEGFHQILSCERLFVYRHVSDFHLLEVTRCDRRKPRLFEIG